MDMSYYEDNIWNAVSVGDDSDMIAAITDGIAVAYYMKKPNQLVLIIESTLTSNMQYVCKRFATTYSLRKKQIIVEKNQKNGNIPLQV